MKKIVIGILLTSVPREKYLLFHENLEIRIFWLFTNMLFDKKTNVVVKNIAFIISE